MHAIIKIAVVSVLALFAIVGVVSISKAEISDKAIICEAEPFDLFYEFGEEEITHHSFSVSDNADNTQHVYKVFTTDLSYFGFNKTAQWLEDYSEFKSRVFYLELENMMLSVGGKGAYQCELFSTDAFKLRLDEYLQSIQNN
jgi:hypothetical protein